MRGGNKEGWCNFVPYPILMIGQVESGDTRIERPKDGQRPERRALRIL